MTLKEIAIREYISEINFSEDWSYETIETEIAKRVGERPTMDVKYKKDVLLVEGSTKAKEILTVEKITFIYTDLDEKIKKIEILL